MPPRLRIPTLLALLLWAVLATEPAAAKVTTEKAIWGPLELNGQPLMPEYAEAGIGVWQFQIRWERAARTRPENPRDPSDPAYVWGETIDKALEAAEPYGIQILVLVQGTPRWANGGRDWQYPAKNPKHYADFMEAASRRWPGVRRWMIWGEPNGYAVEQNGVALSNFMGIESDNGRPLPKSKREGPRLYAQYLDAAYGALKKVSRSNIVIGGNTWSAGAVRPIHWIRALKLPNGRAPRMDYYGHNPGSERIPNIRDKPQARGTADFSDLDTLMKAIDKHLGRRPGGGKIKVFLSEWTILTDHGIPGISFFVSEKTKARWIRAGMRIVRRYKRINGLGMHKYVDATVEDNPGHPHWGLVDEQGNRKLSWTAFAKG